MDATRKQMMDKDDSSPVEEGTSPGALLLGAIVLIGGGIGLLSLSHAAVADVGGAMLAVIGLALGATSIWISSQREN